MKPALVSDATKSAKSLAQAIAKQMAREPLEILKNVGSQVTGAEVSRTKEGSPEPQTVDEQKKLIQHQNELHDKMKSNRLLEALNREISDIRKQDVFKDLQAKIAQGIEVPIEDYAELSMEQKQVLRAQMEAVKKQKEFASQNQTSEVPAVRSKPSRRFGAGQKQQAQKEQTRVEKPVPPSG